MKKQLLNSILYVCVGTNIGILAGCSIDSDLPSIQSTVALRSFDSCDELETYIEDGLVREMRNRLDPDINDYGGGGFDDIAVFAESNSVATAGAAPRPSGPNNYSRTNDQVVGVNEADFVKTDGTHIYVLSGGKLHVTKSWPAEEMETVSELKIQGQPREMFLEVEANRLTVISGIFGTYKNNTDYDSSDRIPEAAVPCSYEGCGRPIVGTRVDVIDVSDKSSPNIIKSYEFPGQYRNARRTEDVVRLVLVDNVRWPEELKWYPEESDTFLGFDLFSERRYKRLMSENEDLIRSQDLSVWLPQSRIVTSNGSAQDYVVDCAGTKAPTASTLSGLTNVVTLNLSEDSMTQASVIARADEVYASATSLYFTSRHYWWWHSPEQRDWTYIFRLDTSEKSSSRFAAAGGVEGHLLNQFSMDEHDDHLRVATTLTKLPDSDIEDSWATSTNRITVFNLDMREVGRTRDVADGERIYSARFSQDRGYIVTFREVDPLFTVDLKDPTKPRIIGELKVPGFSTYIHPLGDNHLITIGIHQPEPDANGRVEWDQRSIKLSMFDVTDFANPTEVFTRKLGTTSASSEALYEHKAFTFFDDKGLLAIPFADYYYDWSNNDYWTSFRSEVRVFSVDTDSGFTPLGAVSMSDIYETQNNRNWSPYWTPWVKRSVIADDYVYAISDAGIKVAHVDSLSTSSASVLFNRTDR
ncbi:MAG: beta-propeller domain-containing protein [Myxococcota bacterium]|nr:beta-propeller domain-containing protein [Myxococcota bacterium]